MLKACIFFSAACLFVIGCYVMFKPDLSDLGFIPVVALILRLLQNLGLYLQVHLLLMLSLGSIYIFL